MRLSNREKMLLALLIVMGASAILYNWVYLPQVDQIAVMKTEVSSLEANKTKMEREINEKDGIKLEFEAKQSDYFSVTGRFRPAIIQESIIREFESMLAISGINGDSYNYDFVIEEGQNTTATSDTTGANQTQEMQTLKNAYNQLNGTESVDGKIKGLEYLVLKLKFTSDYASFYKLVDNLDRIGYYTLVDSFNYSTNEGKLIVDMTLKFPAFPKLDESKDIKYIE